MCFIFKLITKRHLAYSRGNLYFFLSKYTFKSVFYNKKFLFMKIHFILQKKLIVINVNVN